MLFNIYLNLILKLNKWHPKTNKTIHDKVQSSVTKRKVQSSDGDYNELDHHIRLSLTIQLRLTTDHRP